MEFDKRKILTVVTADQAKVGQKGWFADELGILRERVKKESPNVLEHVDLSEGARYIFGTNKFRWSLFYPAPEPTYRPFKNAEEFKPFRDEWFRVKNGCGFDSVGYYDNTGVKDSTGNFITYEKLFEVGERENGEPCGVREEA